MKEKFTVALAGNPNSGKTTVFNALTGARQHVANYPGVTVEIKEGRRKYKNRQINVVDLPGTYSLSAYSTDELVARNYIIGRHPDVVVQVVDASNLERNLYLATHLMEMNVPLVLAFNMSDIAERRGLKFDLEALSALLEVPIVRTVGSRGEGTGNLIEAIIKTADSPPRTRTHTIRYGAEIEREIEGIEKLLDSDHELVTRYGHRWPAVKLLERDSEIITRLQKPGLTEAIESAAARIKSLLGEEPEMIIADRRYGFISGACQETVKTTVQSRHEVSDKIDAVLTNHIVGLPIFFALMYLVFQLAFSLGAFPMQWLEGFFAWTQAAVAGLWPAGSPSQLKALLTDGVISGVGGVVVFLPNILLLFFAIAVLEDSGYMARAAFIMDRIMHKIGLHGKSFIPMVIGFGCSVPAIMATRILENRRNRITTILVIPLMSCGARFTIYMLIIPAFFPKPWWAPMLVLIYLIGIVLAVISARLLRSTLLKGETMPFVMELPPYRMPTLKSVCLHMWQRGWMYLKKAGTIILAISIILWAAANYPKAPSEKLSDLTEARARSAQLQHSAVGRLGKTLEPVLKPLGFDWKIGTALIGATAAKEVFISQMAIIYAVGTGEQQSEALRKKIKAEYTPLTGFCVMVFCLISLPCVATLVITAKETGSWLWAAFQAAGLTSMAYVITLAVYQIGTLLQTL